MNNPWWKRRKRKSPWFNDIYDELERLSELLDETMQKALDNDPENILPLKRDRIHGYFIQKNSNRNPNVNNPNYFNLLDKSINIDMDPLIDFINNENFISVLISLPGVKKDEIKLRVTENNLHISVDTSTYEWSNEFQLPSKINPKTAIARYKNAVLQIKLEKFRRILNNNRIY